MTPSGCAQQPGPISAPQPGSPSLQWNRLLGWRLHPQGHMQRGRPRRGNRSPAEEALGTAKAAAGLAEDAMGTDVVADGAPRNGPVVARSCALGAHGKLCRSVEGAAAFACSSCAWRRRIFLRLNALVASPNSTRCSPAQWRRRSRRSLRRTSFICSNAFQKVFGPDVSLRAPASSPWGRVEPDLV